MSANAFSLLVVNGSVGLLLGASVRLAIDMIPWLSPHRRWLVLGVLVVVWAVLVTWITTVHGQHELILRRWVNAVAGCYVASLLLLYAHHRRKEEDRP